MEDAGKKTVHPGFAEQSFEEWVDGADVPLPEGFKESSIAKEQWMRGAKIDIAAYRYRLYLSTKPPTSNRR